MAFEIAGRKHGAIEQGTERGIEQGREERESDLRRLSLTELSVMVADLRQQLRDRR